MRVRRLLAGARTFANDRSGLAMIEFALLAPVMLALYFGTIEITQSIIAKRRLNLAISTMGDLTARVKTVGSSDVTNIFGAAGAVMAPIDVSTMKMRISSVIIYPTGVTCVDWSIGSNMTALTAGSAVTMPLAITGITTTATRDYILAEGNFAYTPITHRFIPGSTRLSEGPTYLVPRQSDRVAADTTIQSKSPCP